MTSFYHILIDIQETQSFDRLESFRDPQIWATMTEEEQALLAKLFVFMGVHYLSQGDSKVLEAFDFAAKISHHSSQILYEQGKAFAHYQDNLRCLYLASQALSQAVEKDKGLLEAWLTWGEVLVQIGVLDHQVSALIEADQKFEHLSKLISSQSGSFDQQHYYWVWGQCLAAIGQDSEEPYDYYRAIAKYRLAHDQGCQDPQFLCDYSQALIEFSSLVDAKELLIEALKCLDQATQQEDASFNVYFCKGIVLSKLYEALGENELIEAAIKSFEEASKLDADSWELWLKWGQIESFVGKIKRDVKLVESALSKFAKAHQLEQNHAHILGAWGEAELFLGSQQEQYALIQSAKQKVAKSLHLQPENPDLWYLYGACYNELGRYFNDEGFYRQAIERFQQGLSLNRRHPLLWYGLSLAYFTLGDLNEHIPALEKANLYCSRMMEFEGKGIAQFWNDWGVVLLKLGELTEERGYIEAAIEKFERALKQPFFDLENTEIDLEWAYNYGCAYDLLGEVTEEVAYFEKAVQILSHVVQLDSTYIHARYNLALALTHLADEMSEIDYYQKAVEHFQWLVEIDPEEAFIRLDYGIALTQFALLVQESYQPEKSQEYYRQAEIHLLQAAYQGHPEAYYQLAAFYSLIGSYVYAMHYLERAQAFGSLPTIEDLMHDDWLESLRETPAFRQFIHQLPSQRSNEE